MSIPILSSDPDAVSKLKERIAQAENLQDVMKACNAALRSEAKNGKEAQIKAIAAELVKAGGAEYDSQQKAARLVEPDFAGRLGFPSFELTNNSANIRRMYERLEQVQTLQTTPGTVLEGSKARLEDCPSDNRVRLFFPGKPSASVRDVLKSRGFRWAPTMGCWQAYRNEWALQTAREQAGIEPDDSYLLGWLQTTAMGFQTDIEELARKFNRPVVDVVRAWKAYAQSCQSGDMSPVMPEFADVLKRQAEQAKAAAPAPGPDRFDMQVEDNMRDACGA